MSTRFLATVAAAAAFTAGGVIAAVPAHAGPGEGCAGLPEMPTAYVCIVSLTPEQGLPGVSTSSIPVRVPPVCYVAGCTQATTVNVPVPGTTEPEGNIAVLSYQGTYYPIGIGLDVIWPLVEDVQILAGNVVGIVTGAIDDLPSTEEILLAIRDTVDPTVSDVQQQLGELQGQIDYYEQQIREALPIIAERVKELIPDREFSVTEVVDAVRDALGEHCLC